MWHCYNCPHFLACSLAWQEKPYVHVCLTSTESHKNMTWLFSKNSSPTLCSGCDSCRSPAKQLFPADFLKLFGVKSWALWRPLPGQKEWTRKGIGAGFLGWTPLHFSKPLSLAICFVSCKMSRLFQPCLRGHQAAGLINDDCDGLCHVKSYINEKEHWSYFIQNLECILLSTAIDKTLRPDHRPLQTSGKQRNRETSEKHSWARLTWTESRVRSWKWSTEQAIGAWFRFLMAGSTEIHWVQLVADDGLVSAIKVQRTGVPIYSWDCSGKILEIESVTLRGQLFPKISPALLPVVPASVCWLTAHSRGVFFRDSVYWEQATRINPV